MKSTRTAKPHSLFKPNFHKTLKLRPFHITSTIMRCLLLGVIATVVTSNVHAIPKKACFKSSIAMVSTNHNQDQLFKNAGIHNFPHVLNHKNNFSYLFSSRLISPSALKNKAQAVMLRFDNKSTGSSFGIMAGTRRIGFMFVLRR